MNNEPVTLPRSLPLPDVLSDERYYFEWGREAHKQTIPFLNDVLRLLVTLNTTLLGGSILLLQDDLVPRTCRVIVVACFWASLACSICGVLPYRGKPVDLRQPYVIRDHKAAVLKSKERWLRWAAWSLLAGFAAALVGLLVRLVVS